MSRTWTIPARIFVSPSGVRGCSSMVEPLPSKQITRVRFPSSAPQYGKPRATARGFLLLAPDNAADLGATAAQSGNTKPPTQREGGLQDVTSACRPQLDYYEALFCQVSRSSSNSSRCQVSVSALVLVSRIAAVVREGQESVARIGARLSWTGW